MDHKVKALVLAAGKGTRLQTEGVDLPKVMRLADGKPLLHYVLSGLDFLSPEDVILVVGWKKEAVLAAYPQYPHAVQAEQHGTGHAVQCAAPLLEGFDGHVLVCCGDAPLMKGETFRSLTETHLRDGNACTLLSSVLEDGATTAASSGRRTAPSAPSWRTRTAPRSRGPSGRSTPAPICSTPPRCWPPWAACGMTTPRGSSTSPMCPPSSRPTAAGWACATPVPRTRCWG